MRKIRLSASAGCGGNQYKVANFTCAITCETAGMEWWGTPSCRPTEYLAKLKRRQNLYVDIFKKHATGDDDVEVRLHFCLSDEN